MLLLIKPFYFERLYLYYFNSNYSFFWMNVVDEIHDRLVRGELWEQKQLLKRNEYLTTAGTVDSNLYYIVSGSLKISITNADEEHIIRFGYQKNMITALDSFITDKPSEFFIQAIKKTEVKVISKKSYLEFIHQNSENKQLWDIAQQQLILQQLEREKDILTTSPKERYERVFKRSPQLFQEIPNKYIASYLRMTPETLSRLKKS